MTALLPAQKEFVQSPPQGFCERRRNFFDFKRFVENLYFFTKRRKFWIGSREWRGGIVCVCVGDGFWFVWWITLWPVSVHGESSVVRVFWLWWLGHLLNLSGIFSHQFVCESVSICFSRLFFHFTALQSLDGVFGRVRLVALEIALLASFVNSCFVTLFQGSRLGSTVIPRRWLLPRFFPSTLSWTHLFFYETFNFILSYWRWRNESINIFFCFFYLAKVVRVVPALGEVTHQIILEPIVLTRPSTRKFYKLCWCEFCSRKFVSGSGLDKHIKSCHSKHFENALDKYFEMANATGNPKVVAAINLIKSDCLGMENFEILLDGKPSVKFYFSWF